MIDGRLPVGPRERLPLCVGDRDDRHVGKLPVERPQVGKIESAVECGQMRHAQASRQRKVQIVDVIVDEIESRRILATSSSIRMWWAIWSTQRVSRRSERRAAGTSRASSLCGRSWTLLRHDPDEPTHMSDTRRHAQCRHSLSAERFHKGGNLSDTNDLTAPQ